jgi:uncharacterized protein YcgL (UPF0745 family)
MKVTILKSRRSPAVGVTQFLVLPETRDTSVVPVEILDELGELVEFKELDLRSGENRVAVDVEEALRKIAEQGYYVARTEIRFREQVLEDSRSGSR